MARRRDKGLFDLLVLAPWWVSLVLAIAAYGAAHFAPSFVRLENPALAGANVLVGLLSQHSHFVALPFLLVAGLAVVASGRRRKLLDQQSDIESIRNLSWQEFELLVGEAFRRQGYAVEENGGGGADGGVDLRLRQDGKTYIVQCKRWKTRQVGVAPIREIFGLATAEGADGAFFVSSGTFTRDAEEFARANDITLIDGQAFSERIETVRRISKSPMLATVPSVGDVPSCPKCGGAMVARRATAKKYSGQEFLGCASFPKCRGIRTGGAA